MTRHTAQLTVRLAAIAGMLLPAWIQAADSIAISRIGSFYIGGKAVHLESSPARPRVRRPDLAAEQVQARGDFVYGQKQIIHDGWIYPQCGTLLLHEAADPLQLA